MAALYFGETMKFYGQGVIFDPESGRAIHDFIDGPFETEDARILTIFATAPNCGKEKPAEIVPEKIAEAKTEETNVPNRGNRVRRSRR